MVMTTAGVPETKQSYIAILKGADLLSQKSTSYIVNLVACKTTSYCNN